MDNNKKVLSNITDEWINKICTEEINGESIFDSLDFYYINEIRDAIQRKEYREGRITTNSPSKQDDKVYFMTVLEFIETLIFDMDSFGNDESSIYWFYKEVCKELNEFLEITPKRLRKEIK